MAEMTELEVLLAIYNQMKKTNERLDKIEGQLSYLQDAGLMESIENISSNAETLNEKMDALESLLSDKDSVSPDIDLSEVCDKLDEICSNTEDSGSGSGIDSDRIVDRLDAINSSIGELKDAISDLQGKGLYNSIEDICDKLDEINNDLGAPDMDNVEMKLDSIDSRLDDIRDGINDLEGTTREILGASIFN